MERAIIYYNDTVSSVSKLIGEIVSEKAEFVELKTISGLVTVPMRKVIRIERQGGQNDSIHAK